MNKKTIYRAMNKHFIVLYLLFNPIIISMLALLIGGYDASSGKYVDILEPMEAALLGLYSLVWMLIGLFWIVIPFFRGVYKRLKEPPKMRTTDEIIDDIWEEHKMEMLMDGKDDIEIAKAELRERLSKGEITPEEYTEAIARL